MSSQLTLLFILLLNAKSLASILLHEARFESESSLSSLTNGESATILSEFDNTFVDFEQTKENSGLIIGTLNGDKKTQTNEVMFEANEDYWLGFQLRIVGQAQELTPLLFTTQEQQHNLIELDQKSGGLIVNDEFLSISNDEWIHVTVHLKVDENWYQVKEIRVNGEQILFNQETTKLNKGSLKSNLLLGVGRASTWLPNELHVQLDNVAVARGARAASLVRAEAEEGVHALAKRQDCVRGSLGCFCTQDMNMPCNEAGFVCVKLKDDGYCTRGDDRVCKFFGIADCPCAAAGCAEGLTCIADICQAEGAKPTTQAVTADPNAGKPTHVGGGHPCPVPVVSPADWFAVLIAALLLFAALIRWSSQLLGGSSSSTNAVATLDESAAEDYLISGGQITSPANVPVASFSPLPPPPSTGNSFSQYGSANAAMREGGGRQIYRPLPPAPEAQTNEGVFEIYSKLPGPPPPIAPGFEDRAREMAGLSTPAQLNRARKRNRMTQRLSGGKVSVKKNESLFAWAGRIVSVRVFDQVRMGDIIIAVFYMLLHIGFFYGWHDECLHEHMFHGETWQKRARATGTLFGYMATTNSMLVALPATRNSLLGLLLGLEYDRTIMFHRWLGRWTLFLLMIHGIPYFPIWFNEWDAFVEYRTVKAKFHWAVTAAITSIFIAVTSHSFFRRKHFQFFFWAHFAFVLYYVAGSFHSPKIMFRQAMVTLGLYMIDRILRFFWGLWPRRCKVNLAKDGNVVQVVFSKHRLANYAVGNYVFLNFPQVSFWEWHPFTLSSGPHDEFNECHIKALGDFTGKLYERACKAGALRQRLWLRVDGPYGKFSLNHERYPVVVLIGGGVGVTPQIACLKDIFRIRMSVVARVDHARRGHIKHVYFVWSAPDRGTYMWFHDVFTDCLQRHEEDPTYPQLHLFCHLTRAKEVPPGMPDYLFVGRPDMHQIMGIICDERQEELKNSQGAVFACGPSAMVNGAWDSCTKSSKEYGVSYSFHHETFDF